MAVDIVAEFNELAERVGRIERDVRFDRSEWSSRLDKLELRLIRASAPDPQSEIDTLQRELTEATRTIERLQTALIHYFNKSRAHDAR